MEVEEHHVGVYASKDGDSMTKAPHPVSLLRGSLVSPSLEAAVPNGKYISGVHLPDWKKSFPDMGLPSPDRTWQTGQSNVQNGILPYSMIICTGIFIRSWSSMQMRCQSL